MLINMERMSMEHVMCVERKGIGNKISLKKAEKIKEARQGSRATAIIVVRKGIEMLIV